MSKAKKTFYVQSEMIKARNWSPTLNGGVTDEIVLSKEYPEGGSDWEFNVSLVSLGSGIDAMKLSMFADAFLALADAPEVFQVLAGFNAPSNRDDKPEWPRLIKALETVGWKHYIPTVKAGPTKCSKCGK